MQIFQYKQAKIHFEGFGNPGRTFVWAHGWGQNRAAFRPLARTFERAGMHLMVDFPGFGTSPPPPETWGTEDYADALAALIREKTGGKVTWIGHSFGCRVGLQLAARHPELVDGLFLVAAAGLKRKRPLHKQLSLKARVLIYKGLKKCVPLGLIREDWLKSKFGAADYRNASGVMRSVFVKVVNEDLSAIAAKVSCPVTLVYGSEDDETPPEIGARLQALIPGSKLVVLEGLDHYSVLAAGRHQTAHILQEFIEAPHA